MLARFLTEIIGNELSANFSSLKNKTFKIANLRPHVLSCTLVLILIFSITGIRAGKTGNSSVSLCFNFVLSTLRIIISY